MHLRWHREAGTVQQRGDDGCRVDRRQNRTRGSVGDIGEELPLDLVRRSSKRLPKFGGARPDGEIDEQPLLGRANSFSQARARRRVGSRQADSTIGSLHAKTGAIAAAIANTFDDEPIVLQLASPRHRLEDELQVIEPQQTETKTADCHALQPNTRHRGCSRVAWRALSARVLLSKIQPLIARESVFLQVA